MKKVLIVVLMVLVVLGSVFAGDHNFIFTELGQHSEILGGFFPTLVTIGDSYEGLSFIEGNDTKVQFTLGGGLTSKSFYLNPVTGQPLTGETEDVLLFDAWQARINLKIVQGLGKTSEGKDFVTVYAGYEGRWEKYVDYLLVKGFAIPKSKTSNTYKKLGFYKGTETVLSTVRSIDDWFESYSSSRDDSSVYPEMAGDYQIYNSFYIGAITDNMIDENTYVKGTSAEFKFKFAPNVFNKAASYVSLDATVIGGKTLYQSKSQKGLNLYSFTVKDRFNINWTSGSMIPSFVTEPASLGRKVRGFETNSYGSNLSIVNNFDLRFAFPEAWIKGLFPRAILFFDMGLQTGNYFNTEVSDSNFLTSTGVQFEISAFGFCDLGIQYSYLIAGKNMKDPMNKFIFGATFFLDF